MDHLNLTEEQRRLFEKARDFAVEYIENVDRKRVYPDQSTLDKLKSFDESLSNNGCSGEEILTILHKIGSPATVSQTGGRYFGFVNGSVYNEVLAAKWLADIWDQNPALHVISPIVSKLEEVCEQWLIDLFGLPKGTVAGLVSGTSTATMCGLAAGRNELLKKLDWDVNQKGLMGAPKIRIVLGEQAHATVYKALSLLGFGRDNIEEVPVDDQGRMEIAGVPELDERTLLILQAGNVNTGSFDPIDELCDLGNTAGAWIHIDGAFGLWAATSSKKKYLTKGIEKADSWSVDGHKTLNTPYDCGIVLCKNSQALVGAMQASGSYIKYGKNRDSMMYTPEMSRRSRAVDLWATLKFLGKQGIEDLIDRLCKNASVFAEQLKNEGFRILNQVDFNQVLVACDTPIETTATLERIQQSGECWCGGALWNEQPVIRISVCSWKTNLFDIEKSVAAFVKARKEAKT